MATRRKPGVISLRSSYKPNDASSYRLSDDQLRYVERAIGDAEAGRFASDGRLLRS
jgi:hypothetical protein